MSAHVPDTISSRPLTVRQAEILAFVGSYLREHAYPPTLREIGARFGIRSTNGVTDHLRALERKGFLTRDEMKSRAIRVVSPEAALVPVAPALPNALRKLAAEPEPPPEPIATAPEDMGVRVYVFRGRPCVIAWAVGRALGYSNAGKKLIDSIRDPAKWASEFIDGKDVETLRGDDLREFKALLDGSPDSGEASKTSQLTVLFESGWDLACINTNKPEGVRLRRRLADEVLPKLRRGEPVGPALPSGETAELRALVRETVATIPAMVAAAVAQAFAALPQAHAAPALPAQTQRLADAIDAGRRSPPQHIAKAEQRVSKQGIAFEVPHVFYSPAIFEEVAARLAPASASLPFGGAR